MQMFKEGNDFCKIAAVNLKTVILYNIAICESQLSDIIGSKPGFFRLDFYNPISYEYILRGWLAPNTNF